MVKNPPANEGDLRDVGLIPGLGRSPGGGHDNPLQCSFLENPHGQRSLEGYSPWSHKESDTTEATWHACGQTVMKGIISKNDINMCVCVYNRFTLLYSSN